MLIGACNPMLCRIHVFRPFLLGMYAFGSTTTERAIVQLERRIEYVALKERWKEHLGEGATDIDVPGEDMDDQHQFIFIQVRQASAGLRSLDAVLPTSSAIDTELSGLRLGLCNLVGW